MMEIPQKIETTITIQEVLSPRTCHASLPNGKIVFGFISKDAPEFQLEVGGKARVQMDVADFSRAEMLNAA
ncbi:MAG: hypothetical protein IAE77_04680 [Prosthecobacter sp.]|jgi:hypothetical protein|uniref:hypothetical protein n=1 Tax=Prosthecobacter sp. TaxID=1965333 RepID=UPI0019E78003|nr:hypothetical protein [Prosthecobacter sp.]MBE2282739.1 hypothetical protein [Prosthecobacter sp.]